MEEVKGAYGDPKLLLKKKLSQIGNISQLSEIRDQERLVNSLSKIINMMREQHNIKSRL